MDVYSDSRVHAMSSTSEGSYEVETSEGWWAVVPQNGSWRAASYFRKNLQFIDLGPYDTRDAAIQAILDRY